MKALLLGQPPERDLGYCYVDQPPYEAVVLGSVTLEQMLGYGIGPALEALAKGIPVILYAPGLPQTPKNRGLSAALASRRRELKSWGVVFTDGAKKHLVTAQEAKAMVAQGRQPDPGAVLTPLAKEVLEGSP